MSIKRIWTDEVISDEEYSIRLKKMNEYCDDECLNCEFNGDCFFSEIKK